MKNITVDVRKDTLQRQVGINARKMEAEPTKFTSGNGDRDGNAHKFACQTCSFAEAANLLSISVSTIYRMIDEDGHYYNRDFPKPFHVSIKRRVFFVLELLEYLRKLQMNH